MGLLNSQVLLFNHDFIFVLIGMQFWPLLKGQQLLTTVNTLTFLLVTDIALSLPIISFQHASVCVSVASLEQLELK